jgi:hypothetical protein
MQAFRRPACQSKLIEEEIDHEKHEKHERGRQVASARISMISTRRRGAFSLSDGAGMAAAARFSCFSCFSWFKNDRLSAFAGTSGV